MDTRYNVYFAGQLLDGRQLADVREKLGKLFNADQQTLDKLFSGKAQLLKRDCDKATALKYKQAMERAGASPIVRSSQDSTTPASPERGGTASPAPDNNTAEPRPLTAAQKIAALAAAPDEARFRSGEQEAQQAASREAGTAEEPAPGEPGIAPAGEVILQAHERSPQGTADIDVSGLAIDAPAERLAPVSPAPPPAPDTSHLDMGEVGDTIPGLPRQQPPEPPDTSDLGLTEGELDLSEFAAPAAPPPVLDLSDMQLAPAGADVLDEQDRRRDDAQAPATDHLSLQE